jgi:hypothetical protein
MNRSKHTVASARSRRARKFEMAPVARAVRAVLAISATTLALGASGAVFAAGACAPAATTTGTALHCAGARHVLELQPVVDLTRVMDDQAPSSVIAAWRAGGGWAGIVAGDDATTGFAPTSGGDVVAFGAVQDLTAIGGLSPGPGGVSGADDVVYAQVFGDFYTNTGVFIAPSSASGFADIIFAQADHFNHAVFNAEVAITGYTWAAGMEIEADTYAHDIRNSSTGVITTTATGDDGQAWGIYAVAGDDVQVYNDGSIQARATGDYGTATGLFAYSIGDTANAANTGTIAATAIGDYGQAWGIYAAGDGNVSASNSATGTITATANGYYGRATGISAYSINGDAGINNDGSVFATADMDAIGLYGYAYGDVNIANTGSINASSGYGLADGIFASGATVDVDNSGRINAVGYSWAAGIEADGGDQVSVSNSDRVIAISTGAYGQASGIYANGGSGGASVDNSGYVRALGAYSYGIHVEATGPASVTTTGGAISAGDYARTYLATGIDVHTTGGDITVGNDGSVHVESLYGSTGISASTDGIGSNASVVNGAYVYATASTKYGYGATGIVTFADGDSSIDNGGSVRAQTDGIGYGAIALSFNGNASVDNSGYIQATGTYYGAYGAVAGSTNGAASIDNSGLIQAGSLAGGAFGIQATSQTGSVVDNSGDVTAFSLLGYAVGIQADSGLGDTVVDNSGGILAYSNYYVGRGIQATSSLGDVFVTNSGQLGVDAKYAYGVFAAADEGDANVTNAATGLIDVYSSQNIALGVFGVSTHGDVSIDNAGGIAAAGYALAFGAYGRSAYGAADVTNSGDITAMSYDQAIGAYVRSIYGASTATNAGSITAVSYDTAVGIFGISDYGDAAVSNAGGIEAYSYAGLALGAFARADYGMASVDNSGAITTQAVYGDAVGIRGGGLTVDIANSGAIDATGYYSATGIDVLGQDLAAVGNAGSIHAVATSQYGTALGIYAGSYHDVSIDNAAGGTIQAEAVQGAALGISAYSYSGDIGIDNAGDISASGLMALGVAASAYGGVDIANTGSIDATGADATGILASALDTATVANSGTIMAAAHGATGYGFGIYATSVYGSVSVDNSGSIDASADYINATGAYAGSAYGDVALDSSGSISAYSANGSAVGLAGASYMGSVAGNNGGTIEVDASHGGNYAIGLLGNSLAGNVMLTNAGSITTNANAAESLGVFGNSFYGAVGIGNSGHVEATSAAAGSRAIGLYANAYGDASVDNSGTINATSTGAGGIAYGIVANAYAGSTTVTNSGTINATDDTSAVGVSMASATGSTFVNTGTVQVYATAEGEVAVQGGDGVEQVVNQGDIHGALVTAGGDDAMSNGNGGTWFVDNHSTDFGDGNDTIDNLAGGRIRITDGAIQLGSSTAGGNAFNNAGTIEVSGTGTIDMGSGPVAAPLSRTQSAVPSLNALALVNDGVIDFVDGSTDDVLTITGDLDGSGAINLDVSALNGTSDTLYVDGSIADGAVQVVNATFQGTPSLDGAPIAFAFVTGDSSSTSFVAGQVAGYNPNNFIDVKTTITSTIDASNASADVFSVGIAMDGLNDAGVLAASVASGAHSLINSQVGTWRQRMGVLPRQDDGGLSPWIRVFSDDGEVDQRHVAADFTDSNDFRFKQSNQGRELGMNFALPGGFNYGVLLAKADGKQRLLGGTGNDRIDLSSVGIYGTWISSLGFYLDASYRWMDFDADLSSVGGAQSTSGNATAFNLEAGYTGWQVAGIDIVPQAQYTRTEITNIDALHGDAIEFAPEGGDSSRGRLGVGLSKAIAQGGVVWTPYGSVNAVREFDGENRYTVAGDYHGLTRTDGTSAMVELGLGMQTNGFSITGGANWTDGGAQHGFFGGQLVVRYSW